jgi:hypothetical protein
MFSRSHEITNALPSQVTSGGLVFRRAGPEKAHPIQPPRGPSPRPPACGWDVRRADVNAACGQMSRVFGLLAPLVRTSCVAEPPHALLEPCEPARCRMTLDLLTRCRAAMLAPAGCRFRVFGRYTGKKQKFRLADSRSSLLLMAARRRQLWRSNCTTSASVSLASSP